jgi:hypothetical protein
MNGTPHPNQKIDSFATTQKFKPKTYKTKTLASHKKLQNRNYALESQITKSDLRSHKMGLYPMTNISTHVHTLTNLRLTN